MVWHPGIEVQHRKLVDSTSILAPHIIHQATLQCRTLPNIDVGYCRRFGVESRLNPDSLNKFATNFTRLSPGTSTLPSPTSMPSRGPCVLSPATKKNQTVSARSG